MIQAVRSCLAAVIVTAAAAGAAQAELVQINCGAPVESKVLTSNTPFQTVSKTFVRIHGAALTVRIPRGQRRCVKVRFTGIATCTSSFNNQACFVRALGEHITLFPQAGTRQSFGGPPLQPTTVAYQWVGQAGPGDHIVQIQLRTDVGAGIKVSVDDWTMDVETTEVAPP